jgi:quercetin dioxygenase-like cupin family protein
MSIEPITKPYRVASGEGLADVWWKSGRVTVKVAGPETGDAFAQFEIVGPRGDATPWHVHRNEDETYYVLEGEVTLLVGDERYDLVAGDFLFAPRDVPHTNIVRSERARMLVTTSPAGVEQLFVSLGIPVSGAEAPTEVVMPSLAETARVFGAHGVEILGPPPTLDEL